MKIAIISCSLKDQSLSRVLSQEALLYIKNKQIQVTHVDMRDYPLPFCDALEAYNHAHSIRLKEVLSECDAYLIATPVYNFSVNAVLKNMTEIAGSVMENKIAGFLCAAGGQGSFMSVMGYANSLMLDFRCWIIPRFVYATRIEFDDNLKPKPAIIDRIHELCDVVLSENPVLYTMHKKK